MPPNMPSKYVRIEPGKDLPNVAVFNPFRAVVAVDDVVSSTWQRMVSAWHDRLTNPSAMIPFTLNLHVPKRI